MSVLNNGNNLPGTLIDFESEVSQDYDPSLWGTTESVLVIGTAFQGPVGTAVRIYNTDMARYYFGSSYDNTTHRSASLVPGIQAAYERGCRTIYAMRLGGKNIYKDFRLCEGTDVYCLRVSGLTPSNVAKQCFFKLNVQSGYEEVTIYKPASRATIAEKRQGAVENANGILSYTILLNQDNGLTRNDKLIDFITTFNSNSHNNVLHLSVVDRDGNDVTTAPEVQDLHIGSLFSGIYFIGRDKNADGAVAYKIVSANAITSEDSPKPYSAYNQNFYYTLDFNSDVSSMYPIAAKTYNELKSLLRSVSVTAGDNYDFLTTPGQVDRVWLQDDTDYEEVDLTNYEIYEKLGSGFAITAKAVERKDKNGKHRKPRVIETPSDDDNHIVPITEGVYSLIENTEVDYRVLVAANADDKITAKLPKADAFMKATPNEIYLLGDPDTHNGALIRAIPKIDSKDYTPAKAYEFHFKKVDDNDIQYDNITDIYTDHVAKIVARVDGGEKALKAMISGKSFPDNTEFMVFEDANATSAKLYRTKGKSFELMNISRLADELYSVDRELYVGQYDKTQNVLTFEPADVVTSASAPATYKNKEYILVDNGLDVYVSDVKESEKNAGKVALTPLGSLEQMLSDEDNANLIYVEDAYGQTNHINITTAGADYIPLEEFMEVLQNDETLGRLFTFSLTDEGADQKSLYPEEIEDEYVTRTGNERYFEQKISDPADPTGATMKAVPGKSYSLAENKTVGYDYSLYIPYRTNDNFVRQLAQHCAYATLRTKTTHGVIGYSPLRNFTLKALADRAEELVSADFSLYAKKNNGRMMLNANDEPYEIGGKVSVTSFQYPVTDTSNSITTTVNGAAGYAGMISTLPVEQSTTNQPTGLTSVDYSFSNSQLRSITEAGFITTKYSDTNGIVIADGVTMAPASQYQRRLSVVRTVNACGDAIRAAAEPYIGKKNSLDNRNALKTAIDSALGALVNTLIWDYKFTVINLNSYTSDSHIDVNYDIFPIGEIRNVNNSIRITHQSTNSSSTSA